MPSMLPPDSAATTGLRVCITATSPSMPASARGSTTSTSSPFSPSRPRDSAVHRTHPPRKSMTLWVTICTTPTGVTRTARCATPACAIPSNLSLPSSTNIPLPTSSMPMQLSCSEVVTMATPRSTGTMPRTRDRTTTATSRPTSLWRRATITASTSRRLRGPSMPGPRGPRRTPTTSTSTGTVSTT